MKNKVNKPAILDVTIREGSCAQCSAYSAEDVAKIVSSLSDAGVEYIEASQGLGIGAAKVNAPSGGTDQEYAEAAASSKGNAKVGAIGDHRWTTVQELKDISKYLDFFRIGSSADNPEPLKPFIKTCKDLGITVMTQLSRGSQTDKKTLAKSVKKVADWGADIAYIVDTTGCFIPDEIEGYIDEIRKLSDITLGFHGHNTFGLALANAIAAIRADCKFVDASLLGIGRDSGNVSIAPLVAVLERLNIPCDLDIKKLIIAGDELIKPITAKKKPLPWYPFYLAYKKRDFWPYSILEFIGRECGKSMWEVLEAYTAMPPALDFEQAEFTELIKRLGGNPEDALKKLAQLKDIF